jgi:hypothetical protein
MLKILQKFSEADIDFCFKQWGFATYSLLYLLHVQARNIVKVFIGLQFFSEKNIAIDVTYTHKFCYIQTDFATLIGPAGYSRLSGWDGSGDGISQLIPIVRLFFIRGSSFLILTNLFMLLYLVYVFRWACLAQF